LQVAWVRARVGEALVHEPRIDAGRVTIGTSRRRRALFATARSRSLTDHVPGVRDEQRGQCWRVPGAYRLATEYPHIGHTSIDTSSLFSSLWAVGLCRRRTVDASPYVPRLEPGVCLRGPSEAPATRAQLVSILANRMGAVNPRPLMFPAPSGRRRASLHGL